jgi:peroxiredoxin
MGRSAWLAGVLRAGLAALVSGALAAAAAAAPGDPAIGKSAPDFAGVDSNGVSHRLSDLRGKTVVLEWTNHECPFVGKHYGSGNMQALQKEATAKGVVWLSVISSAPGRQGHVSGAQANTLTDERGAAPSAVLLDPSGEIGKTYGARATPHMFVIAPDGTLVYKGAIDDKPTANKADIPSARNYVRLALGALAKGETISPAATRAYGCSVKYAY